MPNTTDNVILETQDYNEFKFLHNNRDQNRGHVEALKVAFQEIGNLTEVQPILVNENMEIIDGQHRYVAAKELGQPIFYSVRPGLGVSDARTMNLLHRNWTVDDFAKSYADSGNADYQRYLQLREDYPFGHAIILNYALGEEVKGAYGGFRKGEFRFDNIPAARARLDNLSEAIEHVGVGKDKYFAFAMLKAMEMPGYDQRRMVRKLDEIGEQTIRRYGSVQEYLRALEETYNYRIQNSANRIRLY